MKKNTNISIGPSEVIDDWMNYGRLKIQADAGDEIGRAHV